MPKVYIVSRTSHDYSSASEWGELVHLTKERLHRFNLDVMHQKFNEILKDSQKTDLIILGGMTIMSIVACSIFATMHNRLNILLWESKTKKYFERVIQF